MKMSFNEALKNAVNDAIEELFETGGAKPCRYCEYRGKCEKSSYDEDDSTAPTECNDYSADWKAIERDAPSIERDVEDELERAWYDL